MNTKALLRHLARAQLAMAATLVPKSHREWMNDMRAEAAYIESDFVALRWAAGCVIASLKWRVETMLTFNRTISRPVLMLEWLMCFLPLTLLWIWALIYLAKGVPADIAADIFVGLAFATFGPVALVVALLVVMSKRSQTITWIAHSLVLALGAMCLLQLFSSGAEGRLDLLWFRFDPGTFVLLSLLPLLGCLHLAHLSKPAPATPSA